MAYGLAMVLALFPGGAIGEAWARTGKPVPTALSGENPAKFFGVLSLLGPQRAEVVTYGWWGDGFVANLNLTYRDFCIVFFPVMNRAPVPAFKRSSVQAFCILLSGLVMITARALAADYTVATTPANFVIKAPAEWTKVQCHVVHDKIIVLAAGDGLFDENGTAKNATFTVVVSPIAPYSLTSPSPPAPLAPGGTGGQATVTYKGSEQASLVESFEFKKPEGDTFIRLYVVPVKLQSIGFGNTIGDLQRDDGTTYEPPQWQDGNHDNVVLAGSADPGEDADRNYPVGFVRNTKPKLTDKTVVKLGGPLPDGITLYLGAESDPNGVEIDDALLQVDGSHLATLVAAPVESTEVLHDSINYYDAGSSAPGRIFQVDWKVRLGGGNFLALAETRHTLYTTAAMPIPGKFGLRESMVYYACYGARGADPDSADTIADAIQERVFRTNNVKRVPSCRAPEMQEIDGNALKYAPSVIPQPPLPPPAGYLPFDGSNVCDAWAELMRDTFKVHGLSAACKIKIKPRPMAALFDAEYQVNTFRTNVQTIAVTGQDLEPDKSAVSHGQGNGGYGVADGQWVEHVLTGLAAGGTISKIYDPSYGTGPFEGLATYEKEGIAGFRGESIYDAGDYLYWADRAREEELSIEAVEH